MPKLSYPEITKGKAITALLSLYRDDSEFAKELEKIRRPYMKIIFNIAKMLKEFDQKYIEDACKDEFSSIMLRSFSTAPDSQLPPEIRRLRSKLAKLFQKLDPYFNELDKSADKFKLRANWASQVLFDYDFTDFCHALGMKKEMDIPLELIGNLYPWSQPVPNLVISITPWTFTLAGREEIEKDIRKKLDDFEKLIKSKGYNEFPSSLQDHARWWFKHYVKKVKYKDIAGQEINISGGKQMVYERTVGTAVRQFSKLIGIDPEILKH